MGAILWLYQTKGLFMICAPDTDMAKNSYDGGTWTVGHKKKKKEKKRKKKESVCYPKF